MSLAAAAIEKKTIAYFAIAILAIGGMFAFGSLGQLEDPDFTVKTAVVTTFYPGASPHEVELEVTDRVEKAIQELPQVKNIYSSSSAGVSTVAVDIHDEFWADRLPQVWDELRNKMGDVATQLPPGAGPPEVGDDFSFVYGFVLAVTGDGFSPEEVDEYVDRIRKELALVPGVSRAEEWGSPDRVVWVDASQRKLAALGLSAEVMVATLTQQNTVVDAGGVDLQDQRFRIAPTGEFRSPEAIGDLLLRATAADAVVGGESGSGGTRSSELIRIRDVADVHSGFLEPPRWEMRWNGEHAQGISLANVAGGNIVETGRALDQRLEELVADLPVGIEVHKVAWQSDQVSAAVSGFMVNLAEAIAIVLLVLTIPMGWRMGVIIGTALLFTILGTFLVMAIFDIDLHRMSLGALVIALGMMVDNSIVVADGIYMRLQRGMERKQAAIEAASAAAWPLLGATVVAVMAFYPIFASTANAGEYCRALFTVVAISLLLSWLLSMTLTPLQCIDMLKVDADEAGADPYGGALYQRFRGVLAAAIRARVLFLGAMLALLVVSIAGFGYVNQLFFPDSNRAQLMIDYWGPEGTRIQDVSEELRSIEARLLESPYVTGVASFVGAGPPRFYLPVDPEGFAQSYAQLVVNLDDYRSATPLVAEMEPWALERAGSALVRVRKYGVGPSDTWKLEARFSGPGNADLATLRGLAREGRAIIQDHPWAHEVRTDMRQRVRKVVPDYLEDRARWASITREDIANATKRAFDGTPVGLYREGDDLLPILLRHSEGERQAAAADLDVLQIQAPVNPRENVPLSNVADVGVEWEDPIIVRWNRRRAITVQASPDGVTFPSLYADVIGDFDAIDLPAGYELFWDGELYSTQEAQKALTPGIVPAVVIILFIIVALFNAMRPPLIIILTIPFVMIGITAGLLATGAAFGFVALLGAMSLVGMMIKNAIVLLDQIDTELAAGKAPYPAIVDSALSRLRPVALAAATTVLGVVPLLQDVFWVSMAITIMAGLTFGTVLTMLVVPALYALIYKVPSPDRAGS
jgi:multidrug efflux pump subunit AcrB